MHPDAYDLLFLEGSRPVCHRPLNVYPAMDVPPQSETMPLRLPLKRPLAQYAEVRMAVPPLLS